MQTPLRQLLAQFRDASRTEREKGNYFERLAVAFLKNDPGMAQEYEDAWLLGDWAKANRVSGADIGVDVVAKIRGEDSFCAVQCKFYTEGRSIPKSELDKFLAACGSRHFSRGLIIETTGLDYSANATALFDDLNITTIGIDRLEASPIDWAAWLQTEEVKIAEPKHLRPHQIDALAAVHDGFAEADRGKLIMACGTGKTFTGLKIAEAEVGAGGNVLVLVPSLALMSQTIREWTIDSTTPLRSYAVCSDAAVGRLAAVGPAAIGRGDHRADMLFLKRGYFRHEDEARLLAIFDNPLAVFEPYRVQIDPNRLFTKIEFDPRLITFERREREAKARELGYEGEFGSAEETIEIVWGVELPKGWEE